MKILIAGLILMLAGLPLPAEAQGAKLPPGENILFSAPTGFKAAYQNRQGNQLLVEYVPNGESVEAWNEMVTLLIAFGVRNQNPTAVASNISQQWAKSCATAGMLGGSPQQEKDYPVTLATLSCVSPDPAQLGQKVPLRKYELMTMKVIQGRDSLYIVQRAWHSDTVPLKAGAMAPAGAEADWSTFFRKIEVCDTRLPDQPCRIK